MLLKTPRLTASFQPSLKMKVWPAPALIKHVQMMAIALELMGMNEVESRYARRISRPPFAADKMPPLAAMLAVSFSHRVTTVAAMALFLAK